MFKKLRIYNLLILICVNSSIYAQFSSEEERMNHANDLFENKSFIEAEPHMLHFLSTKSNSEFNFKYGVCALFKYADKSKSISYLERSVRDSKVDPRAHFYLGKAKHLNYLFAQALKSYNKFKSLVSEKEANLLEVDMHIKMCESGQGLLKNLSDLIVEDKKSTTIDKFQYSYDLSEIGGRLIVLPDQFRSKIDEKLDYKSVIYFPPIGRDYLLFSSYGKDEKNGLDIYSATRLSTGDWSQPTKLPESINTVYDDNYPYLHPDGKTLYFSSKGHNSMGGYDVFRCSYDANTNNYGPVQNLDYKINTTDDDVLYIVDDNNENAYFSSKRASDGGMIDVYKVKVKVFPIQNTVIAGTFSNSVNPEDAAAKIKVQDIKTDNLIGLYTANKKGEYTILLPNAGKYKFIIETSTSEKIHAGLVEVKPQTELKALKQEIELVSNDGVEGLVIRNLFDQSHENETEILALVVKQMANPEINIDQVPDSLLNEDLEQVEDVVEVEKEEAPISVDSISDEKTIDDLLADNNNSIENAEESLNKLNNQREKASKIAQSKALEAEEKAIKANQILEESGLITDESEKNKQLQIAAKLNAESVALNEEAQKSISVIKTIDDEIDKREENINDLKDFNSKLSTASNSEENIDINELEDELDDLNQERESPKQALINESKEKEKKANEYLNEAQALRSDNESMQYQLDQQKDNLTKAKKKKDVQSINENIETLEQKIAESQVLIDEQFKLYEEAEKERKNITDQVDQMDKIELAEDIPEIQEEETIDIAELEQKTIDVNSNYIEKNSDEFDLIVIDEPLIDNDEDELKNEITNNIETESEPESPSIVDTLIQADEIEHYNEVSETLESTTTDPEVFENLTETIISYNNEDAQSDAEDLDVKKQEIISIENEISSLENELASSTKPSKIEEIQNEITIKKNLLSNSEDQLVKSYEDINKKEIDHNNESFKESTRSLSEEAKSDEDFLSATVKIESANNAIEKAKEAREEANKPETSPEKRKELIKEAYQNEMVAIDEQQTANNLMNDVKNKYPVEQQDVVESIDESEINELSAEQEQENEFIESLPVNIPVVKEENPVAVQRFQGVTFDPKAEPENYEVVPVADPDPVVKPEEISNASSKEIIVSNQKNIDKVNELKSQQEILELQKNDLIGDKLIAKVDKKIKKIEKKKAKSQIKMADDIAQVNQTEINVLTEQVNSSQKQSENVKDKYKVTQANKYNESAKELSDAAVKYREEAEKEKDPIEKANLIEKAISSENTAIGHLNKSKKLYEEAIVEDFSDDKLTVAKSVQLDESTQSEKLEDLSRISENQSIEYQNKAQSIRNESSTMSKKEMAKALVLAQQYDDLAIAQKTKSDEYKEQSKKYKEIEMAIVEDIALAKEIEGEDMSYVVGTEEFKSYNENQKELNSLELESEKIKQEKSSYDKLSAQMNAKAEALDQQAKSEKNPIKKADLINESNQFKIKAKETKQMSEALVISIDSLRDNIRSKKMDQEIILGGLDSTTARQVKGLAISGKADEILEQMAQDLPENNYEEEIELEEEVSPIVQDEEEIVASEEPEIPETRIVVEDVRSNKFIPPKKVVDDIFQVTEDAVYSDDNPIPVNPPLPDGLVYKVQVGAFRNPIPQDLFKGFAPISAEKVRDDITRYRVGYFTSFDVANESKNKVRELGYKDAFVVAIMNGDRVSIKEAKSIQSSLPPVVADIKEDNDIVNNVIEEEETPNDDVVVELNNDDNLANALSAKDISGVFYSVQVGAFSKPLEANNSINVSPLVVSKVNGLYKYSTGNFKTIEEAGLKKANLLENGILDAFIIAYSDGVTIPLSRANSSNPNRPTEYSNPDIYFIDLGTYQDSVPKNISDAIMNLRALNIRSRAMFLGKQYYSQKYNSLDDAESALERVKSLKMDNAKIIKVKKDDFDLNYEFKIDLGTYYEDIPLKIQTAFNNLKNLDIKSYRINDGDTYYSISRNNYEDASTDLNSCKSQDLNFAKIVVFKDGVETSLDNVLKTFK